MLWLAAVLPASIPAINVDYRDPTYAVSQILDRRPAEFFATRRHAAEVTDLAQRGMVAAHEVMMKNSGGMMGRGMRMRGAMAEQ